VIAIPLVALIDVDTWRESEATGNRKAGHTPLVDASPDATVIAVDERRQVLRLHGVDVEGRGRRSASRTRGERRARRAHMCGRLASRRHQNIAFRQRASGDVAHAAISKMVMPRAGWRTQHVSGKAALRPRDASVFMIVPR
jgi:hypothetical protein